MVSLDWLQGDWEILSREYLDDKGRQCDDTEWVAVFKQKRTQVVDHHCAS